MLKRPTPIPDQVPFNVEDLTTPERLEKTLRLFKMSLESAHAKLTAVREVSAAKLAATVAPLVTQQLITTGGTTVGGVAGPTGPTGPPGPTGAAGVGASIAFTPTAPVSGDFAWINQGGASINTTLGVYLLAPATAGENLRIRKKAAPAVPYIVTAAFVPTRADADFSAIGIGWRQSSDGKLVTVGYVFGATAGQNGVQVYKYTSPTVGSAQYSNFPTTFTAGLVFMRISDDGVDRKVSVSADGTNWVLLHTVVRTDFLTGDEILFFANANNATFGAAMTLLSWLET